MMVALEIYEATLCGLCELPRRICQDPNRKWAGDGPYRCHASTAVMAAQERHGETNQPKALHWQPVELD